jgi:hypothetical protein
MSNYDIGAGGGAGAGSCSTEAEAFARRWHALCRAAVAANGRPDVGTAGRPATAVLNGDVGAGLGDAIAELDAAMGATERASRLANLRVSNNRVSLSLDLDQTID